MTEPWEIRRDLMARWFAVAISVGFAATLVQMRWLNEGELPDAGESQQLARLLAAMIAVLFSWEGYFFSIATKKLTTPSRFFIDFFLVLLYMILLYTSKIPEYWIYIHTISFLLYVAWDVLTIKEYPAEYVRKGPSQINRVQMYLGSALGREGCYRGPAITMAWAGYFLGFSVMQVLMQARNSWVLFLFVVYPLHQYRTDKRAASADWREGVSSYKFRKSIVIIVLLWVVMYSVFQLYHGPALGANAEDCDCT